MTKKLIIMGILMIPFLLLTRIATAQTYETMPEEVQAQMDLNKINQVDQWTNIKVTFTVEFSGLEDAEFATAKSYLSENMEMISVKRDLDGKIIVEANGNVGMDSIKRAFSGMVDSLVGFTSFYSLKK